VASAPVVAGIESIGVMCVLSARARGRGRGAGSA
jgi:hypothetical protein